MWRITWTTCWIYRRPGWSACFWRPVASRNNWSPLSGLALIAIAILMSITGTANEYVVPAVTIGAAVGVATSMFAGMTLGIGVDYAIHLLERYRLSCSKGLDREAAITDAVT